MGTSLALVLAGCAGGGGSTHAPASAVVAPRPVCSATTTAVARRVYDQSATGANLREAVRRLRTSRPLADAVARGERRQARRILTTLDRHQFAEVGVLRRGHVVAQLGSGAPALAPVAGRLAAPGTRFVVSVGGDAGFARMAALLTGGRVTVTAHRRTIARAGRIADAAAGASTSFAATAFPTGPLAVELRS